MARSSGIPRGRALAGITAIIRARARAVTVSRPAQSTGSLDETTETTSDHQEDIYLHDPNESIAEVEAGERTTGDLGGLVVADGSVDIEHGDRITYGGVEYEVDTVVGYPEDGEPGNAPDTNYWRVTFIRRQ